MPNATIREKLGGSTKAKVTSSHFSITKPVRVLALVLLLSAVAISTSLSPFFNGDIWWHLSSGLWILQNHGIPRGGLFSQYANRPWVDTSWGFDVITAAAYRLLGLRAFAAVLMAGKLALAGITFLLARGRQGNFWWAIVLSAAAQFAIAELPPLPILCSIVFFAIELLLLFESRRSGDLRPLYWLPLLFFLWANLHGQFLNGLVLLGLFLLAAVAELLLRTAGVNLFPAPTLDLARVFAIGVAALAATILTPYSFQLFQSVFQAAYAKTMFTNFQEMQAMAFRRPQDFVLLLLAMGAFLALGRQRSRDLFKLSVMVVFLMLAFRVQRDGWCVVLPAIAVIGDAIVELGRAAEPAIDGQEWKWTVPVAATLALGVLATAIVRMPGDQALMMQIRRAFPVKACDFIRSNRLPGPVFDTYYWGGFLTWYLPEYPVSIDGRVNLYGDEITERYFKVSEGTLRLETDPSFTAARIILLDRSSGMLKALTTLPALQEQFRVAYQDDVASVLVRQ